MDDVNQNLNNLLKEHKRLFMFTKFSREKSYKGTPCLESFRGQSYSGHAIIKINKIARGHHLVVFEAVFGKHNTKEFVVHHNCENKICVNPFHLEKQEWEQHSCKHNAGAHNPNYYLKRQLRQFLEVRCFTPTKF